jgi:hypothetical protein
MFKYKQAAIILYQFDSVWAWGNPLLSENRTFAGSLENHTSYRLLATVTRNMFYTTYNAWLQELFRAELTIDNILQMMRLYAEAQNAEEVIKPSLFSTWRRESSHANSGTLLDQIRQYGKEQKPQRHARVKAYIAHRLNCDEQRVTRMLLFVDVPEVLENLTLLQPEMKKGYVVNKEQSTKYPAPTSQQIDKLMTSIYHPCAAGFEGCVGDMTGRFAICSRCYKHLGSHIEAEWDELTRKWLPAEIRRIRSVWKKDARNAWYQQQYTEISEAELEQLGEDAEWQLVS